MDLEFYSVTFFESCHLEIMGLLRMVTPEPSVPVCPPHPQIDPTGPAAAVHLGTVSGAVFLF